MTQDFLSCKMEYTQDAEGKEVLLKDGKFQVMMEWEKPYMHACIDVLKPFGDVLEIGFGLAYSAERIQSFHPKSHTIIEYHPEVAKKAREWAKQYPNVTIIEDTWQNALINLGIFDAIFFDDYPLQSGQETQKLQETATESTQWLHKGNEVLKSAHEALPSLSEIRYADKDLNELIAGIPVDQKETHQQLVRFLEELQKNGQIQQSQLENMLAKLVQEKRLSVEEIDALVKRTNSPDPQTSDRLMQFLDECLQFHMRDGSRFSCFLSSSSSKYEDERFVRDVIANPFLDFHEEEIAIDVPANCGYFTGAKALVILITKRSSTDVNEQA
jgi:hypothetical protein